MKSLARIDVAALVIAALLYGAQRIDLSKVIVPSPTPATLPTVADPPPDLRPAAETVVAALVGRKDVALPRAWLYASLAEQIDKDGLLANPKLTSTDSIRRLNELAGKTAFDGTTLAGSVPVANEKIDALIVLAMGGLDNKSLDAGLRARAGAAFRAAAWACVQVAR